MTACSNGALTTGQRAQVNAMQSAFPSVYSDAEAGIQSRFAAGEINEAGKGLKTDMLNEFAAALASLHSEANK